MSITSVIMIPFHVHLFGYATLLLTLLLDQTALVNHMDVVSIMFTSGRREHNLIELQILTT